jgi:Domain of unknown function (DUF4124)
MKPLVTLAALALLPVLANAENVWRWTDADGTLCYSNQREHAPASALPVETRLIVEAAQIPETEPALVLRGNTVTEAAMANPEAAPPSRRRPIYTEERRRFGCYASGILFSGGWAHPDDINVQGNCLPYLLGPEAWLNSARAELALREHGLDWRQVALMYLAERQGAVQARETAVADQE